MVRLKVSDQKADLNPNASCCAKAYAQAHKRASSCTADRQLDERSDGQTGRFEQIKYPRIQLLSLPENVKAKEST